MTATTVEPAPAPVHPFFEITFATRDVNPTTHWIEGEHDADNRPSEFFSDMAAIGFVEDGMRLPPWTSNDAGVKVQSFMLSKKGTGLFGAWSPEEKKANMAAARKVMRKHNFSRVPVWRKTMMDMM